MIIAGLLLLIAGLVLKIWILWIIGIILLIAGAAAVAAAAAGHELGGRRHYW
jgi:hypothetical protein